jgi:hypothetical protein
MRPRDAENLVSFVPEGFLKIHRKSSIHADGPRQLRNPRSLSKWWQSQLGFVLEDGLDVPFERW